MERSNRNYDFTSAFVDGLASMGLRHVCLAPGSRNSPLALPFAAHPAITDWIHHDERSAAFFALGLAKTTRAPAAVVTTSGTAAAELHPAAVEARLGRVPLLLLTADRPPELRDLGAPQAIDQIDLFGSAAKWFHEAAVPERGLGRYSVALAARAWSAACDQPAGPVHINFPFRDPLAPLPEEFDVGEDSRALPPTSYRPARLVPNDGVIEEVAAEMAGKRLLIVAGPLDQPGFPAAVAALAEACHSPIIADPLSQLRAGPHDRSLVVTTGDVLARIGRIDDALLPQAVIRFGAPPTSKALTNWLATHADIPQIVVDEAGWRDPGMSASMMVRSDPVAFATLLTDRVEASPVTWATAWLKADRAARAALHSAAGFPTEPGVVTALADALPHRSLLYVASSMPVRDLDAFFPAVDRDIRIVANRGANGIDGFVSSALGAAATGAAVVALAGDLSLLHDLTALGTAGRLGMPLTVVVVNNDGGGIFHFLPQARFPDYFERLLGTPHGTDFGTAADLFGVGYHLVDDADVFRGLVGVPSDGPRLIEVRTDRHTNVAVHDAAWRAVQGT